MPILAKATGKKRDITLTLKGTLPEYWYRKSPSGDQPDERATGAAMSFASEPGQSSWNGFSTTILVPLADAAHWDIDVVLTAPDNQSVELFVNHAGDSPAFGNGYSNGSVIVELVCTIKNVEEWVRFRRTNPQDDPSFIDSAFPQKGYTGVEPDPDNGSLYPFKNGIKAGLLFSRLTYYEWIEAGSAYEMNLDFDGHTATLSGNYTDSRFMTYGADCTFYATKSRLISGIDSPSVDAVFEMKLSDGAGEYPYNFSSVSYSAGGDWTGAQGSLTGQAEHPDPLESKASRVRGTFYPDIALRVNGHICQPTGLEWASSVSMKWTWEWDGTFAGSIPNGDLHPDYLNGCPAHDVDNGRLQATYSLEKIVCDVVDTTDGFVDNSADFIKDHHQPLGVWINTLTNQDADHWRIMVQDPYYIKPARIRHKASVTIDDFTSTQSLWQSSVGTVGFTSAGLFYTADPIIQSSFYRNTVDINGNELSSFDWSNYRYAVFEMASNSNQTIKLRLNIRYRNWTVEDDGDPDFWFEQTKDFNLELSANLTTLKIDLKCPDAVSFGFPSLDTSDWAQDATHTQAGYNIAQLVDPPNDSVTETDTPYVQGALYGVGRITKLEFIEIDAASVITVKPLKLLRAVSDKQDEAMLFILPAFLRYDTATYGWEHYDAVFNREPMFWHPNGAEMALGLINYHVGVDLPYSYFENGSYKNIGFPTLKNGINRLLDAPGWEIETFPDIDEIRSKDFYQMGDLSPVRWGSEVPYETANFFVDKPCDQWLDLYAHLACDLIDVYPGIGNPQKPREASNLVFPLRYIAQRGAMAHGTVHKPSTKKTISNVQVRVENAGVNKSSTLSNSWGYFRSTLLNTKVQWDIETDSAAGVLNFRSSRLRHAAILGDKEDLVTSSPSIATDEDLRLIWVVFEGNDQLLIKRSNSLKPPFEWFIVPIANTEGFNNPHLSLERKTNLRKLVLVCQDEDGNVKQLITAAGGLKESEWNMTTLVSGATASKRPHSKFLEDRNLKLLFYCKDGASKVNRYHGETGSLIDTVTFDASEVIVDSCYSHSRGMIVATYQDGTDIKEKVSMSDGKDWL